MTQKRSPLADPRRKPGEELALEAESLSRRGLAVRARELFAKAARIEEEVARECPPTSPRARSVLAVSAVALWYKAGQFEPAKRLAYGFLAVDGLTEDGRDELERLVDRCAGARKSDDPEAELRDRMDATPSPTRSAERIRQLEADQAILLGALRALTECYSCEGALVLPAPPRCEDDCGWTRDDGDAEAKRERAEDKIRAYERLLARMPP